MEGDNTLRRNAAARELNMIGAEIQLRAAASGVVPDDTFTVTQAVNNIGFGKFQIVLSFIVGLCWMADSMEMMILSILPLALQCEWGINNYQQALLTTVVFIGETGSHYWSLSLTLSLSRHDDQLHLLGETFRQVWQEARSHHLRNVSLLLRIPEHLLPVLWLDPLSEVHGWLQYRRGESGVQLVVSL